MPKKQRPTILVVEDEILVRMMLVETFEDAGFKVYEAANADEALAVLSARDDVKAIVVDIVMPGGSMNGLELARRVQENSPDIRLLIASGRAAPEPGSIPEGAYFVAKPFHTGTLVHLVSSLMGPSGPP